MPVSKKIKKEINIVWAISILSVLLLIVFLLFPLFRGVEKDLKTVIKMKKDIASSRKEMKVFEKFGQFYRKTNLKLDKINSLFISKGAPIDFIKFLEETANNYNLSIEISPSLLKKNKKDKWDSIGFKVVLTGNFIQFSKFIKKVELNPHLMNVESLAIAKLSKKENNQITVNNGDIKATLLIKAFSK